MSIAMATWNQIIFGESQSFLPRLFIPSSDATLRPVRVNYVLKLTIIEGESICTQCFVSVSWFQSHPSRFVLGKPAEVGVEICLREMAFILLYLFISCLVGTVYSHMYANNWRKPISCSTTY